MFFNKDEGRLISVLNQKSQKAATIGSTTELKGGNIFVNYPVTKASVAFNADELGTNIIITDKTGTLRWAAAD